MTNTTQVQPEFVSSNNFFTEKGESREEAKIIVIFCGTRNLFKSEVDFTN
jgi:hypothetical protein